MRKIIQENALFFMLFSIYLLCGFLLLTQIEKGDMVLFVNNYHEPVKNFFFKYCTHLGDGLFFTVVVLIFLLIRYYYALMLALNFAFTGLSVIVLKRLFGMPRPLKFFDQTMVHLDIIEGVKLYQNHSFPSGHSATAFSLCCGLILISKNKKIIIPYFIGALLATFSRVYLAQHFYIDTYFGVLWGVFGAVLVYVLLENQPVFDHKRWHRCLLTHKRK